MRAENAKLVFYYLENIFRYFHMVRVALHYTPQQSTFFLKKMSAAKPGCARSDP